MKKWELKAQLRQEERTGEHLRQQVVRLENMNDQLRKKVDAAEEAYIDLTRQYEADVKQLEHDRDVARGQDESEERQHEATANKLHALEQSLTEHIHAHAHLNEKHAELKHAYAKAINTLNTHYSCMRVTSMTLHDIAKRREESQGQDMCSIKEGHMAEYIAFFFDILLKEEA